MLSGKFNISPEFMQLARVLGDLSRLIFGQEIRSQALLSHIIEMKALGSYSLPKPLKMCTPTKQGQPLISIDSRSAKIAPCFNAS